MALRAIRVTLCHTYSLPRRLDTWRTNSTTKVQQWVMTSMSWIIVAGGGTPGRYRATFYKLLSVEYLSHKVLVLPVTEMIPRGIPAECGTPGYVKQIHSICPQIIESTKNIVHFVTSYSSDAIVQCMYSFVYIVPSETIKFKSESNVANAAAFRVDLLIFWHDQCPPVAICFNSQQGIF